MNVNLTRRCLSMLLVLVMLFTMMPTTIIAEELHDHSHEEAVSLVEVNALAISASASANYVYAGEEAVAVTTKISGGMAPYEVKLQAVKDGSVVFTDSKTTDSTSVKLSYAPASWGDYELVVTVHDALHNQELTSVTLAVAEHDMENAADWAASVSGASVSSDWAKSLVSVAKTQIGYKESEKDFVIKSGEKQGYSRYGAWFGTPYTGWNNAFLAFVAEYAKVPNDALLSGSSYRSWVNGMNAKGAYMKDDYTPKAGDIAFLSGSRVGLVESVSGANVTVIEGDVNGAVARKTYAISKVAGFGNTGLMQGLHNGTATAVPTAAPDATKAPEGGDVPVVTAAPTATPAATPVPEEEELIFQATPTPRPGVTAAPKEDRDPLQNLGDAMDQLIGELDAVATAIPMEFSDAYYLMQTEMNVLLEKYLGTTNPAKAEVEAFVAGLELQELYYIIMELDELEEYAKTIGFTEYEGSALNESEVSALFAAKVNEAWAEMTENRAASGTHAPVTGVEVVVSDASDNSMSNGSVTVTSKGSGGILGFGASAKTTNIYIRNSSDRTATISFNWTGTSINQLSGLPSKDGGTYTSIFAPGEELHIQIVTAKNNTTNKLVLSNFSYTAAAESAQVTFRVDASMGSVTVDGNAVSDNQIVEISASTGANLVATPNAGVKFVGWYDAENHMIQSQDAAFSFTAMADMTLVAAFAYADGSSPAYFIVDAAYLYDDLNEANAAGDTIVLAADGTLPAGDYTISAGKTLLVPYSAEHIVHTNQPNVHSGHVGASVFRTMTMASGANLTINGALSVGGSHFAGGNPAGGVSGPYGHIKMASESKIILESGANLYAWGYITGSGSVHAKSGSTVYEDFQVNDWRGGSASLGMVKNKNRVFLFSQYYVQNVEVPMRLDAGASEYGCMSVAISGNIITERVLFIGSGEAMFTLKSGYVTKDYIESEGRLNVTLNGDVEMNGISMTLKVSFLTYSVNSKDYELPINGNMTLDVASGNINISQNLVLQPGAEIIIREGATCTLGTATQMYIFDRDDWGNYCHSVAAPYCNLPYPASAKNVAYRDRDAIVQIDGRIVMGSGVTNANVYTTAHKASIISTGTGEVTIAVGNKTTTAQATQVNTDITYKTDIPITNAMLKNADGSYLCIDCSTIYFNSGDELVKYTDVYDDTIHTFKYINGMWFKPCDLDLDTHYYNRYEVSPTCTEVGGARYVCSCGNVKTEELPALGHLYAVEGYATDDIEYCLDRTCTRCGYVKLAGAEHVLDKDYFCVTYSCTVCTTAFEPTAEHVYTAQDEVVPPTCTVDGYTRHYCVCGAYQDDTVEEAAHTYEVTASVNAVQNADGEWEWAWTGAADEIDCNAAGSVTFTCSVCEEGTEGKSYTDTIAAPGHNWDGGVVTPAKCNADGYTTYTCRRCGVEEDRDFVTLRPDHDYTGSEPAVVAPTCIHEGYTYTVCKNCGYENKYDLQSATGVHPFNIVLDDQVEAVENDDGTVTYKTKTCTVDGTVTYTCTTPGCTEANHTDTIKAPGHTEVIDAAVAATCLAAGKTEGKHCSVCNEILLAQEPIAKLEHNYITDEEASYPATCTATGLTVTICPNGCGYREEKEEPVLPHNHAEKISETAATCYSTGLIVWKCSNCDATKDEVLSKLPHYYGENGYTTKTEPTCMEPGYIIYDCQNDGCTEATSKEVDPEYPTKVDHNQLTVVPGKAATCLETGLTDGAKCSWCGTETKAQETINALGHNVETWNVDVKATCQATGEESGTCVRDDCGETVTRTIDKVIHEEGYQYKHYDAVDATCIADGHSDYDYCEACGIEIGKTVYPSGTAEIYHAYQNVAKDATCTEPGLTEAYQCTRCGAWKNGVEAEEIPAGHTIVNVEAQEKTCTQDGWEAYEYCSKCDYTTKVIIPMGHVIQTGEAKAVTCTEDGWEAYEYCTKCDYTTQNVIKAFHQQEVAITEAIPSTCMEQGYDVGSVKCESCGEWVEDKCVRLPLAECVFSVVTDSKDVTCTEDGYVIKACVYECGKTETTTTPALKHEWERDGAAEGWKESKAPSCFEKGVETRTCSCGHFENRDIAMVPHTYDNGVAVNGIAKWNESTAKWETCTEEDTIRYTCDVCPAEAEGHTKTEDAVVVGHDWEYDAAEAATCMKPGSANWQTCNRCGAEEVGDVIPALGHKWSAPYDVVDATCDEEGHYTHKCEREDCDAENAPAVETVVVPALGHKSEDVPAVDVTCTTDGCTAGTKCSVCGDILTGCEVIESEGHKEVIIPEVEVTCEVDGYTAGVKCSVCKEVLKAPVLTEKAHHLDLHQVAAQAPECEKIGWDAYEYCTKCDYTTYNELSALEHKKVTIEGYDETCTEPGLTDGEQCELCEKWFVEQKEIPAAHKPVNVPAVDVTCTADGCTAGVKCSVCEEILEGCEPILHEGHKEETLEAEDPTCTETGLTAGKKCTVCGEITVKQETVDMLKHNHTKLPAVAPTCEEDGLTEGDWCDMCGHYWIEQKVDPATGHNIVTDAAVEATCTKTGLTEGEHCTKCDEKTIAQEVVPMKEHTEVDIPAVAATCLVDGKTAGKKCSVCGTVTEEPTVVPAPGHTPVEIPAEAPTCTEAGKTAGEKCSVCGLVLKAQTEDPATDHTKETIPAVEATCTTAGKTAGEKCTVCGTVLTEPEDIPAAGHKLKTIEGYDATCTVDGLSDGVQCEVCKTWTTVQTVITAEGHKPVKVPGKAPTCLDTGLTEGSYCSVCKEELVKQDVLDAKGHAPVVDPAVAPTCTKTGLTEGKHCANCPEILQAQTVIAATNHANKAPGEAKAATCTEAGNTAGVYCPDCKTWLEDQKTINPTGHAPVIDKMVPATCTTDGLTEGKHCANCPEILQAQTVIAATNHANKAPGEAKAATCTAAGNTAGVYCPDCKTWLEEQEEIPAINHANKAPGEKKDPTCTEAGNTAGVYCPDCATWLEKQEAIPATGHKMDEGQVTTDYTCTTAGVKTYTCLNGCGHTTTEELPAMHRPEVVLGKAPTCTEPGLTEGSICSACGEELVKQDTIPAAHTWETVKVHAEATCTTDGSKDVRCTVEGCGATDTVVIPATGHTEVIDPAKTATCDEDGLTAGKHCSVCNEVLIAQKVIAGGHRWSKAPCTELGATCSRCSETNTELLEHEMTTVTCMEDSVCKYGCGLIGEKAPGHNEVEIEEIPPMCGELGWTVGTMCSVCGVVIEEPKTIPALQHQIVQYPAKKATFTSVGWEAYEACDFCAYSTKVEIPALGEQTISSYSEFMKYLPYLEQFAVAYSKDNPGTDPVALVIKYIRTGVDRYNSGSWGIMAGYENAGFAKYVGEQEDILNAEFENIDDMYKISGLKNLTEFNLPNGQRTDIGHMFGTMDITYHNYGSVNHADVGGWAGDLVDLLSTADHTDHADAIASAEGDFEKLVDVIRYELLGHSFNHGDTFSKTDIYGDLDAFYVMDNLDPEHYSAGDMTALFDSYFTTSLDDKFRAGYLLENRLDGVSTRSAVREAVYTAYTSNNVINTLEGTRDFNGTDLHELRQAVCYAFADYLCALAGDYVDVTENPYLDVFQSSYSSLAPGIKMETHYAKSADDKQMVYYLAYADVGREDVDILASYESRYPEKWGMARVIDQANFVQDMYGEPESERYIENFNVIVGINGSGYNMQTGEPSGLLIMHGQQYHPIDHNGFFGILDNGRAVIGTTDEYNSIYKGQVREAIAGFGTMLVKDGEIAITAESNYYANRASRTAVGITATGRVVFMVLDGRQEPRSCGGSMIEIAQIMRNAGCVQAINLDGGGSTTFVAREAGSEDLAVLNNPSDGISRSVSTALMMVSTAPSSTAFDHALVKSQYSNLTKGASVQMEATGVSATGNVVDLPEGTSWAVSDETKGVITEDGIFTALDSEGTVDVHLMLGDTILGQKTLNLVIPDQIYFTKDKIDSVYGSSVELPLKARYEGKDVAITADDIVFILSTDAAGKMDGLSFAAVAESKITTVNVIAALKANDKVNAAIDVILYKQGENSFDFEQATGGTRILAWQREVSNSYTADNSIYYIVNPDEKMVTSYAIALDMTQIPIPERLEDLTYMLPGADIEGACAWTFLLQLAERISVLTTVKPKITFDPNFDVDYSEIKLINDYFTLDGTEFDEATNTLTLTLHWIDQTAAIPVETANPLCMVTGLKVTPKDDAAWNDKDQLKPVHAGDVGYEIYMRASGLYSFSQKPENQAIFGLYPFVNPNDASEKGGYFRDTYTEFEDSYTLVRALKNGWYNEDGGFVYYVNGVRNTGIQEVEGLYYDFGDNGVNAGKKTYTGLHVMDGYTYYIQLGAITKGWNMINGVWYYFDSTGKGVNGTRGNGVEGVEFEFEDGRLLHGCWLVEDDGRRQYYYGPEHYYGGWKSIDGEDYFFEKYYVLTGVVPVHESHDLVDYWYELDETTGKKIGLAKDGFYEYEGEIFFVQGGLSDQTGLIYFDGHFYYLRWNSSPVRGKTDWITEDNLNDLPLTAGAYRFDEKGRILMDEAISEENGSLYYYKDGPRVDSAGVVKVDGYYYYVSGGGKVRTSTVYDISSSKANGLIPAGTYRIADNGHILMDTAIAPNKDGALAYYKEGMLTKNAGLVQVNGAYYFVNSNGTVATDTTMYVSKTNDLLPKATYTFDKDGKLVMERMAGDADGNNAVTLSDALLVMDYGAGSDVVINLSNADVNADGKADINDGLLIMQYVSGWDVTLK